ncbi:hypothetical protein Vafri_21726 [Volvox africanus]|uniref:Uncharacterized protein n=1 Tax=Volvox africanus TaxID=51714 RepID=A0A8J4BSC1_9CHLO|nr:hypothetical protein Vafri_21726 [Volvox africanus]
MDDPIRIFTVIRHPRKPGSGRQHPHRSFTLTTRHAEAVAVAIRQKYSHQRGAEPANDCAPLVTSSATGLVSPPKVDNLCQEHNKAPQQFAAPGAPDEATPTFEQEKCLDDRAGLGQYLRLRVPTVRRMGSGRKITPREFPLSVTLPKLRQTIASAQIQPKQSPGPSTLEALGLQQLQPTDLSPQPEATTTKPLPNIEDLIKISLDLAMSREESAIDAQKTPASQHGNGQPRTMAFAQLNRLTDAHTPARGCAAGPSLLARSLHHRSALYARTPIEGVPERFPWWGTPGNVVTGAAKLTPPDSRQQETCSKSKDVTPVEGVPERLFKRRRLSLLPQMQLQTAVASSGGAASRSPNAPGPKSVAFGEHSRLGTGVVGAATGERLAEDGSFRAVEATYGSTGAVSAAFEQPQAIACSTAAAATAACSHGISPGDHKAPETCMDICAGGFPTRNYTKEDAEQEDLTAAAAAASAAALSALRRLQELACAPDAVETEAAVRIVSLPSPSVHSEPSGVSNQGTPAAVKIKRLASAVEAAVHQVTETLRDLPRAEAQSLLRSGLPPHSSSVARRLAACVSPSGNPIGSCARAMESGDQRDLSEGQPGSADIIHRARIDALQFPSRTPSPMGGFRWSPNLRDPEPQLASGHTNGEDMVTPPIGATQVYFAGSFTAPAAIATSTTPGSNAKYRATAVKPSLVEAATSPFQTRDHEPAADAASAFPFSADNRSGTEESEESAGARMAQGHEISPGQSCDRSQDYSKDESPASSDNHSSQECGDGDAGSSSGDSEGLNGVPPTQSSSHNTEQASGDSMGRCEAEGAETSGGEIPESSRDESSGDENPESSGDESSGDENPESCGHCPEQISSDRSPHARDENRAIACTPAGAHHQDAACNGVLPGGPDVGEPEPDKLLASALRHDYDRWEAEDDDMAAEVVDLPELSDDPEQPLPPKAASQGLTKSAGMQGAAGKSRQSAGAQQRQALTTTAAGAAVSKPKRSAGAAQMATAAAGSDGQGTSKDRASQRDSYGRRKSLVAPNIGLVVDENGSRRSTRTRVRPLEYWRGEGKSYGRDHKTMPTVTTIMMRTPEPQWPLPSGKAEKSKRRARAKEVHADHDG